MDTFGPEYYVARRWVVQDFARHRVVGVFADDQMGQDEAVEWCGELNREEDFADQYILMLDGIPHGPFGLEESSVFIKRYGIDITDGWTRMRLYSPETYLMDEPSDGEDN